MNYTSGPSHLGDIIWALIWLRRIPGSHTLFCPVEYHAQLLECVEGREISIRASAFAPPDAKCTWIGCNRFPGITWAMQPDLVKFLMEWGNAMAGENGLPPQFIERQDMLCDWPQIERFEDQGEFDALVINCHPLSGQCPRMNHDELDSLIAELGDRHRVIVTNPTTATNVKQVNISISKIGNLATQAKFIVAVASGASACIHSIYSMPVKKYLMLDSPLTLDYGGIPMPHHGLVTQGVRANLVADALL